MIERGDRKIWSAHPNAALAQSGECLRRGDLMHQVQVNIQHRRGIWRFGDEMLVPYFLE
jgi:hypothetical protein